MEGGRKRWRGQRETTPKPAISIGHLGVRVSSRGGSKGGGRPPLRGANVWQLKSTPSSFHLPLRRRRQPPSSSKAPRRGKNFLGVGWIGGRAVSCSFREESRYPYFSALRPSAGRPPTLAIILGSVHKNRGNKDPFSPTRGARGGGDKCWQKKRIAAALINSNCFSSFDV